MQYSCIVNISSFLPFILIVQILFSNFISNKMNKYCAHTVGNDGYFLQLMMVIVLPIVIITYILYHLGMAANYYTYFYHRTLCILILFSLCIIVFYETDCVVPSVSSNEVIIFVILFYILIERQFDKIYSTQPRSKVHFILQCEVNF